MMQRALRQKLEIGAMLSPAVVLLTLFILVPLCVVFAYSFALRDSYGAVLPGFTSTR